jgi:multidrug efflux pump subunit AcrA (membrane-fusion protein)
MLTVGVRLLAAGVLVLSATGCFQRPGRPREQVFAVNVMPAVSGSLIDYLEVNGDIEASSTIDVFAEKMGEVIGIDVSLGQHVAAGQTIARIDPSRPGQRYVPNPVTAPIAGTITSLPIRIGGTVSMTSPIAKISRTNDLVITTDVAERFVAKMKTGLTASIWLEAYPDEQFAARVTEVSPVVDPVSRTLAVKLAFTGDTQRVKAGMFAEVRIITEVKKKVIKIPFNAIVRMEDKSYVFVVKELPKQPEQDAAGDKTAPPEASVEKREIESGLVVDDKVEVKSGLKAGEEVVVAGQKSLDDGVKVKVIEKLPGFPVEDKIGGGVR